MLPCYTIEEAQRLVNNERYQIKMMIGQGSAACVYLAEERDTPNRYAIKILRRELRNKSAIVEAFRTEAEKMMRLPYPNLVRFYRFEENNDCVYIVMEFIDGFPLSHLIKQVTATNRRFPITEIVRIIVQISRAISHLHRENYIHRDIKPGNILIHRQTGTAYLTDLGILTNKDATNQLIVGTPAYMPPEQQLNYNFDHRVDIYAFAVVLYELLTGRKPFIVEPVDDLKELSRRYLDAHQNTLPDSLAILRPDLPDEVDTIIRRALSKDPAARYDDIMVFARDVHQVFLPQLPPELREFNDIQALNQAVHPAMKDVADSTLQFTRSGQSQLQPDAPARAFPVMWLMLIIVPVLIGAGVYIIGQQSAPDTPAVAIIEDTPQEPEQVVVTASQIVATDSPAPTIVAATSEPQQQVTEATPSDIPASPTAEATPIYTDNEIIQVASNLQALPQVGSTMSDVIERYVERSIELIPLQLGRTDSFKVDISAQADAPEWGLAFGIQDSTNYTRLVIQQAAGRIRLESVSDDTVTVIDEMATDTVTTDDIMTIITRKNSIVIQFSGFLMQNQSDLWDSGYIALWIPHNTVINIEQLDIAYLEDPVGDISGIPINNTYMDLFKHDLQQLRATGNANGFLNCRDYSVIYNRISNFPTDGTVIDALVQEVVLLGSFIDNACALNPAATELDFNDDYESFLDWETRLDAIIVRLNDL